MNLDTRWYPTSALDEEGYPTDEALLFIESYDLKNRGVEDLLNFIGEIWYFEDWGFIRDGNKLELHTGGWSGNEDIIRALRPTFFWTFCWESERRGGHYYFDNLNRFNK